jgi:exodeoxyribonuclease-3
MNVGNPSRQRAERQLEWLDQRDEDVLVLTETSASQGSDLLAARLSGVGWDVRYPLPDPGERGVLLASRARLLPRERDFVDYLPPRVEAATVAGGALHIVGVYVPSRDASVTKTERKQRFVGALTAALDTRPSNPRVLIGDLNILEPDHRPRYPWFSDWEYALYEGLLAAGWLDAYRLTHPTGMEHSWISRRGPDGDLCGDGSGNRPGNGEESSPGKGCARGKCIFHMGSKSPMVVLPRQRRESTHLPACFAIPGWSGGRCFGALPCGTFSSAPTTCTAGTRAFKARAIGTLRRGPPDGGVRKQSEELKRRFNSAAANILEAPSETRAFSLPPPASPEKLPQHSQTAGGEATNDVEPDCLRVLRHGRTFCFDCKGVR